MKLESSSLPCQNSDFNAWKRRHNEQRTVINYLIIEVGQEKVYDFHIINFDEAASYGVHHSFINFGANSSNFSSMVIIWKVL